MVVQEYVSSKSKAQNKTEKYLKLPLYKQVEIKSS